MFYILINKFIVFTTLSAICAIGTFLTIYLFFFFNFKKFINDIILDIC